jgi:hypothetical protein
MKRSLGFSFYLIRTLNAFNFIVNSIFILWFTTTSLLEQAQQDAC